MVFTWGQLGLQEASTSTMELMVYFHDYMIVLLLVIIGFVSYMFVLLLRSVLVDKFILESHMLELIWTLLPMVFLLFMAFPSLYILYLTEDVGSSSLNINAVGHQWYWEYQHANSLSSESVDSYMVNSLTSDMFRNLDVDNRLALPANVPSLVLVTSADVLHSWAVPMLGVKADAVPGRLNFLSVTPSSFGVFYGQCSELCGSNHSFMPIVVESFDVSSPSSLLLG